MSALKGNTSDKTVLVVEDNVTNLKLTRDLLQLLECRVVEAGRAEDALKMIKGQDIDLVLLDILLPDMDGFKVLERAKGMKGRSTVQTVVTTCLTDLESRVRGVELGADDYIVKPVNPRELKARLKVLLKKRRYMDQLNYSRLRETDTAIMDNLTGVYNRDFFMRFMELELKRSQRHEYSTSLVKVVIHDPERSGKQKENGTKDTVLREVASVLKCVLRDIDLIARYEDAGFAMLLPYCEETGVVNVVTRIREALAASVFPSRDDLSQGVVPVVSFGTATFPGEVESVEQMAVLVEKKLESDRINGGIMGSKEGLETGPSLRGKV
ncbi:MAG: response regulator [bacterium]|nr:response regulator [bacterium]MDT8366754.1 response regulator [bacterium]